MRLAVLGLVLAHLTISSLTHVFGRAVLDKEHVPPLVVAILRAFVACAVLLPTLHFRPPRPAVPPLSRRERVRLVVLMALAVPINQFFYILGLKFAPAVHGALLFCLTPICIAVIEVLIRHRTAPRGTWIGAVIALLGVALVLKSRLTFSIADVKGDLIILVSVVAWSCVTVISRPLLHRMPGFSISRSTLLGGALLLVPIAASELWSYDLRAISPRAWGCILWLGVFTSVVAYLLWYAILHRIGTIRAALMLTIQPITTGLLGWLILNEPVTRWLAIGGSIILAGVLVVQMAEAKAHAAMFEEDVGGSSTP